MQAVVGNYEFLTVPLQQELYGQSSLQLSYDNSYYLLQLLDHVWQLKASRYRQFLHRRNSEMSLHLLEFFDFVIPSLFDYHAAVRTSSFSTLVSASYNLTIIFGHCQRTTYFRIMLLFLLQVEYLLDQAHPAYYALLQAPNLLNEEICEILLADLAW